MALEGISIAAAKKFDFDPESEISNPTPSRSQQIWIRWSMSYIIRRVKSLFCRILRTRI